MPRKKRAQQKQGGRHARSPHLNNPKLFLGGDALRQPPPLWRLLNNNLDQKNNNFDKNNYFFNKNLLKDDTAYNQEHGSTAERGPRGALEGRLLLLPEDSHNHKQQYLLRTLAFSCFPQARSTLFAGCTHTCGNASDSNGNHADPITKTLKNDPKWCQNRSQNCTL